MRKRPRERAFFFYKEKDQIVFNKYIFQIRGTKYLFLKKLEINFS